MADNKNDENHMRPHRLSIIPQETILEEPSSSLGIANLVHATPIIEPPTNPIPDTPTDSITSRPRRRSSLSILHTLFTTGHLVPTEAARKRYAESIRDVNTY